LGLDAQSYLSALHLHVQTFHFPLQQQPPVGASIRASTPKFGGFGKNPTPAEPLNGPPFCMSLQISPLTLHSWRPSKLPSKHGPHFFILLLTSPGVCPSPRPLSLSLTVREPLIPSPLAALHPAPAHCARARTPSSAPGTVPAPARHRRLPIPLVSGEVGLSPPRRLVTRRSRLPPRLGRHLHRQAPPRRLKRPLIRGD
jgi:hypothetical protein